MTVRELISELSDVDDEVKDYQVGVVFRVQLNKDIRISGRSLNVVVPENCDVDAKMLWLKAR